MLKLLSVCVQYFYCYSYFAVFLWLWRTGVLSWKESDVEMLVKMLFNVSTEIKTPCFCILRGKEWHILFIHFSFELFVRVDICCSKHRTPKKSFRHFAVLGEMGVTAAVSKQQLCCCWGRRIAKMMFATLRYTQSPLIKLFVRRAGEARRNLLTGL